MARASRLLTLDEFRLPRTQPEAHWEHFWIETKDVEGKEPRSKGGNAAQELVSDFNQSASGR